MLLSPSSAHPKITHHLSVMNGKFLTNKRLSIHCQFFITFFSVEEIYGTLPIIFSILILFFKSLRYFCLYLILKITLCRGCAETKIRVIWLCSELVFCTTMVEGKYFRRALFYGRYTHGSVSNMQYSKGKKSLINRNYTSN